MVERIITAYRAQIYEWSVEDLKRIFGSNKKFWITFFVGLLTLTALLVIGFLLKLYYLVIIALLFEGVAMIRADRYSVKQYRNALEARNEHLDEVADFLRTVIPDVDLYNPEQISELEDRLSHQIEKKRPFAHVGMRLKSFATAVVFPVVTYIAGVFSNYLEKLEISVVLLYGIGGIVVLATVWFTVTMLLDFLRPFFCRDFDAAVSLRESLKDLQLLYFPKTGRN